MTPKTGGAKISARAAGALAGLVLLAMLLRLAAIAYTHAGAAPAAENRIIARNLAAGGGFTFTEFGVTGPTAIRGPAYPMLLAILGPDRLTLALAVNALAGGATVLAVFTLVRRLTRHHVPASDPAGCLPAVPGNGTPAACSDDFGRATAAPWIAATLFAVWPTQLYAATLTQGLSIAVLLTLAALAVAFRRTPVAALAGGALAGLAALTEPALALPLLLVAIVIGRRRHWPAAALYVAAGGVIVTPWLYRNAIVFGGPMPITSNLWRDMFEGNGPDFAVASPTTAAPTPVGETGVALPRVRLLPPALFDRLKHPEATRIVVLRDWTLDGMSRHPGLYLKRCVGRIGTIAFGTYAHRLTAHGWFAPFSVGLVVAAAYVALASVSSDLRITTLLCWLGLVGPMIAVVADARMIPLLDVPLLVAASGLRAWPRGKAVAA